jgi:hypothetical protein
VTWKIVLSYKAARKLMQSHILSYISPSLLDQFFQLYTFVERGLPDDRRFPA